MTSQSEKHDTWPNMTICSQNGSIKNIDKITFRLRVDGVYETNFVFRFEFHPQDSLILHICKYSNV
jgi:hypothetical protein